MEIRVKTRGFPVKVDSWEVNIPCPKCKAQNKVSLSQIKREETIKCRSCGVSIKLQDKDGSAKKATRDAQRAFDDLERALRQIGK